MYIPYNASVYINCTLESQNTPIWLINPAEDDVGIALPFHTSFNDYGLYELSDIERLGMSTIIRLLINDTAINNKTEINCYAVDVDLRQTTLSLYGMSCMPWAQLSTKSIVYMYIHVETSTLILKAEKVEIERSLNVSWSDPDQSNRLYNLIVNDANQQWLITLRESYHIFSAPEDAPPCEVYNFSVTATYVGAIYTGAGCSAPSSVLSTMLPSLPDISNLQSSHNFSLEKQTGEVVLTVYFEVNGYLIFFL